MISFIVSMVGTLLMLLGVAWAIVQWVNKPAGKQIIRAVDALTPGDLAKYVSAVADSAAPSRIEPLQNADSLMSYFERTSNKPGQDAVAAVVAAIFAQREAK